MNMPLKQQTFRGRQVELESDEVIIAGTINLGKAKDFTQLLENIKNFKMQGHLRLIHIGANGRFIFGGEAIAADPSSELFPITTYSVERFGPANVPYKSITNN